MGHDNLDRLLRKKLEARRIRPSDDSWNRLEKELEKAAAARRGKNAVPYWWIAASVVVLVTVGIWFFREDTGEITPKVVDVNTTEKRREKKASELPEERIAPPATVETIEVRAKPLVQSSEVSRPVPFPEPENKKMIVADKEDGGDVAFEDRKVEEVVAQIMEIQEEREITETEIESLLAAAQKEIASRRILEKQTGSVDAMALLEEVEGELDHSFRDRVFKALKEGFEKVRTAVVNRNE